MLPQYNHHKYIDCLKCIKLTILLFLFYTYIFLNSTYIILIIHSCVLTVRSDLELYI